LLWRRERGQQLLSGLYRPGLIRCPWWDQIRSKGSVEFFAGAGAGGLPTFAKRWFRRPGLICAQIEIRGQSGKLSLPAFDPEVRQLQPASPFTGRLHSHSVVSFPLRTSHRRGV
jgi:hypothetical protein